MPDYKLKSQLPRMLKTSAGVSRVPAGSIYLSTDVLGPCAPLGLVLTRELIPTTAWMAEEGAALLADTEATEAMLDDMRVTLANPARAIFSSDSGRMRMRLSKSPVLASTSTALTGVNALSPPGISGASPTKLALYSQMISEVLSIPTDVASNTHASKGPWYAAVRSLLGTYGWVDAYDEFFALPSIINTTFKGYGEGVEYTPTSSGSRVVNMLGNSGSPWALQHRILSYYGGPGLLGGRSGNDGFTSWQEGDDLVMGYAAANPDRVCLITLSGKINSTDSELMVFSRERTLDDVGVIAYGALIPAYGLGAFKPSVRVYSHGVVYPHVLSHDVATTPTGSNRLYVTHEVGTHNLMSIRGGQYEGAFPAGIQRSYGLPWSETFYVYGWTGRVDQKDIWFDSSYQEAASDGNISLHLHAVEEEVILSGVKLKAFMSANAATLEFGRQNEAITAISSYSGTGFFLCRTEGEALPATADAVYGHSWVPSLLTKEDMMAEEYDLGQGALSMTQICGRHKRLFHTVIPVGNFSFVEKVTVSYLGSVISYTVNGAIVTKEEARTLIGRGAKISYVDGATASLLATDMGVGTVAELTGSEDVLILREYSADSMHWSKTIRGRSTVSTRALAAHWTMALGTYKLGSLIASMDFTSFRNLIGRVASKAVDEYFEARWGIEAAAEEVEP